MSKVIPAQFQKTLVEIKVSLMPGGQVLVTRPEGDDPENLAKVIELLATAQIIVARKLGQVESPRIVPVPPGARVQ